MREYVSATVGAISFSGKLACKVILFPKNLTGVSGRFSNTIVSPDALAKPYFPAGASKRKEKSMTLSFSTRGKCSIGKYSSPGVMNVDINVDGERLALFDVAARIEIGALFVFFIF